MRRLWIVVLMLLALPLFAQPQLTSGRWQLTMGTYGPGVITFDGQPLLRNVMVSGFQPAWKGGRFDLREASVELGQDRAVVKREVAGNQSATLQIDFAPQSCAIKLNTTVTQPGPTEFSLQLPPDAVATSADYAHVVQDGRLAPIDLAGQFETRQIRREIQFEKADRTVTIRCQDFMLQDRRARGESLFLVTGLPGPAEQPVSYERTVEFIVEPADPKTLPARQARLAMRDSTRTDVPVPNGGFEDTLKGWSENPRATIDTETRHGGKASAKITIPETQTDRTGIYLVQQVPAKEGLLYQASAWIKAESVKGVTLGDMTPTGADIILEFADPQGKWLAPGSYGDGVYGTKDWSRVSTDACRAPEDVGFAIIFLSLRGTGTGWFDDVTLNEVQQHVMLQEPGHETEVRDNTPTLTWLFPQLGGAVLELSPSPTFDEGVLHFSGLAENTFTLERPLAPGQWYWRVSVPYARAESPVWSFTQTAPLEADCTDPVVSPDHAYLPKADQPAVVHFRDNVGVDKVKLTLDGRDVSTLARVQKNRLTVLPPGGWKPGLHRLVVEVGDAAGNTGRRTIYLTHATNLPRKRWLRQGGVEINGKPQFLLGMYGVLPQHLPEMQAAGYDFVHNYTWDGAGTNETALQYLDACRKHDLQAFIGFDRNALQANDFDFVAERVGRLMAHPALLAWYLFDEPDLPHQYVSPDQLRGLYNLIHALDPTHPVIVTVAQYNRMPEYHDSYDVYWSMDYSTPKDNVTNFERHRGFLRPEVPMMSIVHCYDGRQKGEVADPAKFWPDPATMRADAFMAIAHDSSGLCWWWWGQDSKAFLTVAHVPAAWAALKQTVAQINALKPVLASQAPIRMWVVKPVEDQEVHLWEKALPDKTVIIAVNRDPKPCRIKIESPQLKAGQVKVLFEDRTVPAEAGALTDDFEALGVHVYEAR